jgi:hypothetical protein
VKSFIFMGPVPMLRANTALDAPSAYDTCILDDVVNTGI